MKFADLTYLEIREHANSGALAVAPTGCMEQQGPHLPVDFDSWFAETACVAAAERLAEKRQVRALVLPALPFGPTPEHRGFGAGFVDLPQPLHEQIVKAMLDSLAEQGFRKIVIWQGCGQHKLSGVATDFNEKQKGKARAFVPAQPFHKIWCRLADRNIPGGHADSFATSIAMYLRPGTVRMNKIANPESKPVDWQDPNLDFSRYSATGVIGDPTHSSPELGKKLWEAVIDEMAEMFWQISQEQ